MRGNIYVSLSGQVALEKRLETIATNLSNVNTAGYRAEGVTFSSVLSKTGEQPATFVTPGTGYITRTQGAVERTDNPLDVAVQGDAWLALQTPNGVAYTRDGRLTMSATGQLQSINGYPVLDAGGAPMLLESDGGPPQIAVDGMLTQNGHQVGALGLFQIPDEAKLTRFDNSSVQTNATVTPVLDFSSNGIRQGFVEGSNVNPVMEMTRLIEIQRTFDSIASMLQTSSNTTQDAIKTLGSSS